MKDPRWGRPQITSDEGPWYVKNLSRSLREPRLNLPNGADEENPPLLEFEQGPCEWWGRAWAFRRGVTVNSADLSGLAWH